MVSLVFAQWRLRASCLGTQFCQLNLHKAVVAHEGNITLRSFTSASNSWLTQLQAATTRRCSHDRESEGLQLTAMLKRVPLFRLAGKTINQFLNVSLEKGTAQVHTKQMIDLVGIARHNGAGLLFYKQERIVRYLIIY